MHPISSFWQIQPVCSVLPSAVMQITVARSVCAGNDDISLELWLLRRELTLQVAQNNTVKQAVWKQANRVAMSPEDAAVKFASRLFVPAIAYDVHFPFPSARASWRKASTSCT